MTTTIPDRMQAIVLESPNQDLEYRQVDVPKVGPGQVLVRMAASPINPSDLSFLRGSYTRVKPLPAVAGLEGSGTVVAAGSGVLPRFLLGKRVACGTPGGGWAEYLRVKATGCIPLRKAISLEQAAMLVVNPLTALSLFEIRRRGGHAAMVSTAASGALGQMIARMGRKLRVPVIHVVRRPAMVARLHGLGADHALDSSQPDFPVRLKSLAHELKATLFLDAVGGELTGTLLEAAPDGSTILLYGSAAPHTVTFKAGLIYTGGKKISGFYLGEWMAGKGVFGALQYAGQAQRLLPTELRSEIRLRLPLAEAQKAVELYRQDQSAGKILLVIG